MSTMEPYTKSFQNTVTIWDTFETLPSKAVGYHTQLIVNLVSILRADAESFHVNISRRMIQSSGSVGIYA